LPCISSIEHVTTPTAPAPAYPFLSQNEFKIFVPLPSNFLELPKSFLMASLPSGVLFISSKYDLNLSSGLVLKVKSSVKVNLSLTKL